jgi:iron complex outermembrane receptor protein
MVKQAGFYMKFFTGIKIGLCLLLPVFTQAQSLSDTLHLPNDTLENVTVHGYEFGRTSLLTTSGVKQIRLNNADLNNKISLVQGFNSIAGVRMEERSPGSYRINIRGSSLRSPFGVRNVKIYWNGLPFTDAGGNSYFNQIAYNNFGGIDIYKGPAGSLYGAGTGGLITMNSASKPETKLEYITGSYNLQNVFFEHAFGSKERQNKITYAHNQSNGYRDHTNMRRDNVSWNSRIKISDKQELGVFALFTNMYYQTPGALTLNEFNTNPKASRPAAGAFPSAEQAEAAIYQLNFLTGFTNDIQISTHWKNSTALYASYAQIKNPTVRNYEKRSEPNMGGRTVFAWEKKKDKNAYKWTTGAEYQAGFFSTRVFTNNSGEPGILQTDDDNKLNTGFAFTQLDIIWKDEWFLTAGTSYNFNKVSITRVNVNPVVTQSRKYDNEWAPRIALLKKIGDHFSINAVVSKGYSAPTISELLPSTSIINTGLNAEHGINYELNLRTRLVKNALFVELTGYHFTINDALVQRRDTSGADYYINAGGTTQQGIEGSISYTKSFHRSIVDYLYLTAAYSYNHFRYKDLQKDTVDFSGKTLPGIPANSLSIVANIRFQKGFYWHINGYLASSIFLNDANTAKANAYQLLGTRIGWQKNWGKKNWESNLYVGVDNLLDEQYSLGNDLNDPRGRYYNLAPARNFYVGLSFSWLHKK